MTKLFIIIFSVIAIWFFICLIGDKLNSKSTKPPINMKTRKRDAEIAKARKGSSRLS